MNVFVVGIVLLYLYVVVILVFVMIVAAFSFVFFGSFQLLLLMCLLLFFILLLFSGLSSISQERGLLCHREVRRMVETPQRDRRWTRTSGSTFYLAHKCTRVENPGGQLKFLPKSVGWGSRLSGQIDGGCPPIQGFIALLLTSFSKICLGLLFHPPSPHLLQVYITLHYKKQAQDHTILD